MNSMIWELYKDITNEVPYNENEACICIELNITFPNIETALEFGNTLKNNKKNCKTDDNTRGRGNLLEILLHSIPMTLIYTTVLYFILDKLFHQLNLREIK